MQIKNVRFIIAAITTFSAYAVYVSRVNLSIAIIAMVDDGHGQHAASEANIDSLKQTASRHNSSTLRPVADEIVNFSQADGNSTLLPLTAAANVTWAGARNATSSGKSSSQTGETDKLHREPLSTFFPASKGSVKTPLISQEKFHWDQIEQGHILGAFFYGYILFQIPGARMAELVGAKWIIMAANAGSALISLLFPLSTQLNSIHLLMALRFVMGLCQSAFFPAAYVLFCRWLPEKERSVLLPIMFIGSNMGSISTYIMSSYLISSSQGWPSVFYVSGFICTLVTIFWCIFGSNGPEDNKFISEEERRFIERNVNNQSSESNSLDELNKMDSEKPVRTITTTNNNNNNILAVIPENLLSNGLAKSKLTTSVGDKLSLKKSASCCGEFPIVGQFSSNQQAVNNEAREKRYNALIGVRESPQKNDSLCLTDLNNNNIKTPNECNNNNLINKNKKIELSWPKLLKSVPVWTLILSMYGNEWSNVVICYELPTYLNTALSFPIEQNGVINSFFQLSYTLASPVMSSLGAYMLDKHLLGMRKIHVRKLFQSLATFGQLACFVSVPICGANRGLIIMFMFSAIVFKSCANAGDIMVPGDLSPEYAGTIFAFANSIGNTAGFFVPLLAGAIVHDAYEREQWTPFWLTTSVIMGASGLIFLFLGKTSRQNFSPDDNDANDALAGNEPTKLRESAKIQRAIQAKV